MEYVKVCQENKKCFKMSRLIMGTDHIGKLNDTELNNLLDKALQLGINTFDTSPIYIFDIENRFGNWLKKQKDRSKIHTITKGGFPHDTAPGTYSSRLTGSKDEMVNGILEEIKWSSLHLEDITVYLMHRDDIYFKDYFEIIKKQTPVVNIIEALADPRLRTKYSMIGVSNWKRHRVEKAQKVAGSDMKPLFNSPYFSLMEMSNGTIHSGGVQAKHDDMMNSKFEKGVFIAPYSPLGGFPVFSLGWDAAKQMALDIKNGATIANKDPRYWGHVHDVIFTSENKKRYDRAEKFRKKLNKKYNTNFTLDQMVNAYALAHKRADFIIIGPTSIDKLTRSHESLSISKLLKPKHLEYLYRGKN